MDERSDRSRRRRGRGNALDRLARMTSVGAAAALAFTLVVIPSQPASALVIQKSISVSVSPGDMCLNNVTRKVYVVGSHGTAVIDATNDTVVKTIPAVEGTGIAVNPATNKVYSADYSSSTVTVIDGATDTVIGTVAVGGGSEGVAVNPVTNKVYVTQWNSMSVIDGATDTLINTISLGNGPRAVTANPNTNKVYVAGYGQQLGVAVVDGNTDAVIKTIQDTGGVDIAVDVTRNRVYTDFGGVIDGTTDTLIGDLPVGGYVTVNEQTNRIYFAYSHNVRVVDGAANTVQEVTSAGGTLSGLCADAQNNKIYIADLYPSRVYVLYDPPYPTYYFAEGTTRPNFDPYLCIQNPGATPADVKITYMLGDATNKEATLTVASHSRQTVKVRDHLGTGDDTSHDFSAKVESTNGAFIICERPMYFNYQDKWTGGHDVVGWTGSTDTFYFAEGTTRPDFDPYLCIQNPSDEQTTVRITYMKGDGTTHIQTREVAPRSRSTVYCREELGTGEDASHDFSIEAVSLEKPGYTVGPPIIVERPTYFDYQNKWTGGHDVVGTAAPGQAFYFAEGTTRPGFDTYFCVQNPSSENYADVKITYMKGNGTQQEQTFRVPGHSRFTVNCGDVLGTGDDAAHDFSARVECTNGQNIVAERPSYFDYHGWTGGHDVIGTNSPSPVFYFAEGTSRPGFDTYLCVQNPNATEAQVKITYMKGDGTTSEQQLAVPPNSRQTVSCRHFLGIADDAAHDFSSKVEATNGLSIVVERPMYFDYEGKWTGGHDVVGYQR